MKFGTYESNDANAWGVVLFRLDNNWGVSVAHLTPELIEKLAGAGFPPLYEEDEMDTFEVVIGRVQDLGFVPLDFATEDIACPLEASMFTRQDAHGVEDILTRLDQAVRTEAA